MQLHGMPRLKNPDVLRPGTLAGRRRGAGLGCFGWALGCLLDPVSAVRPHVWELRDVRVPVRVRPLVVVLLMGRFRGTR